MLIIVGLGQSTYIFISGIFHSLEYTHNLDCVRRTWVFADRSRNVVETCVEKIIIPV